MASECGGDASADQMGGNNVIIQIVNMLPLPHPFRSVSLYIYIYDVG